MDPVFSTLCFSSTLRTTAFCHLNRELYLNSLTSSERSSSLVMPSPHHSQLWNTSCEDFPPFALQQHRNTITDILQICWDSQGSEGIRRAEPGQHARLPWCFCNATSPRKHQSHLSKDAYKMTVQDEFTFIFLCAKFNCPVCCLSSHCDGNPPCFSQ